MKPQLHPTEAIRPHLPPKRPDHRRRLHLRQRLRTRFRHQRQRIRLHPKHRLRTKAPSRLTLGRNLLQTQLLPQHQPRAIRRLARMIRQDKGTSRLHAAQITRADTPLRPLTFRLQTQQRLALTLCRQKLTLLPRIQLTRRRRRRIRGRGRHLRQRRFKQIIRQHHLLQRMPMRRIKAMHILLLQLQTRRISIHSLIRRRLHWHKRRQTVGDDQDVRIARMLKPIVQTILRTQTQHKVQIRLTILHLIIQSRVGLGQTPLNPIRIRRQHLGDRIDGRALLKDTVIAGLREQPQPRTQGQAVNRTATLHATVLGTGHDARDIAGECTHAGGQQLTHLAQGIDPEWGLIHLAIALDRQMHLRADDRGQIPVRAWATALIGDGFGDKAVHPCKAAHWIAVFVTGA